MNPAESVDGLGLTGSSIGEAAVGRRQLPSSSTKAANTSTRVRGDSAAVVEAIENEGPEVSTPRLLPYF